MSVTLRQIAEMIDHSLLQPKLTDRELQAGCEFAGSQAVASVCIKPYAVRLAAAILKGSPTAVGTVVGFPHGSSTTATKLFESQQALADGAIELDVVVNVGKVLSGDWNYVAHELNTLVSIARDAGGLVKVIFENSLLEDSHKIRLCDISSLAGAHFVKTSTGYGDGGATDHDLSLMRRHSPPSMQVKAAGGVRSYARLMEVRALGVTRVGATATAAILQEARQAGIR